MIREIKGKMTCSRFTLVPLISLLTILTYVDFFPDAIRYNLSYIVWLMVLVECFVECLITGRIRLKKAAITYVGLGLVFIVVVALFDFFSSNHYFSGGGVIYSILVALLVFICGVLLGNKLNEEDVEVICRWYALGAVLLAIILIINTGGDFGLKNRVYGGLNKNSVGQILSSAATILIIGISSKKGRSNTVIRISLSLLLIVVLFLIRSRTCILCFSISVIIMLLSRYTNKKVKRWIVTALLILFAVIISNDTFRNILVTNILLANRDSTSLDSISSGRISIYSQFFTLMRGHELIGNGAQYYESFYLSVIVQFGYPLGLFLWYYVLYMLKQIRRMNRYLSYGWLLVIISISYSLNGLFEGLPPFGPGTKNFLLWLLFGLAITQVDYSKQIIKE